MVGALVALVSTLFTVAPAQADANGPVTLLPTQGTTFNTIIGSPIELVSIQDPSTYVLSGLANNAINSYYVISNPDEAEITIDFKYAPSVSTATSFSYVWFDDDGVAERTTSAITGAVTYSNTATQDTFKVTTNLSKIAISAATSDSGAVLLNSIALDAPSETSTVELTVQTLVDTDVSNNGLGVANGFDRVSKAEKVVLYPVGSVPATTKIVALSPGHTSFSATVVYGNSINPYFVQASTSVALYRDGVAFNMNNAMDTATTPDQITTSIRTTAVTGVMAKDTIYAGVNAAGAYVAALEPTTATFSAGIYSAQAFYNGLTVGAASVAYDVSAGPSSLVASVRPTFLDSLDAAYRTAAASSASELLVRTGTKTLTIGAQIQSASGVALAASNVEVRAVVSGAVDATTTITVTGAAGSLVKDGAAITALARTDANGKVSFTITSTTGKKGDALSVVLSAKTSTGAWAPMDQVSSNSDIDVSWADAAFSTFTAKPATYISGANPTVTFKAADQWGKGIDAISGKALTVYAVASFGGVENSTKYSATAVVANGEAKFTFANFAAAGGLAQLKASLFTGGVQNSTQVGSSITVNVYNTAATDKVAVVDSFATPVTYVDYVTGDTVNSAVAKAVSDAGLSTSEGVAVTGNVLNTAGVGQPGVAVTVAAKGVLFYADGVYALDTITTNANEFGAFSVTAIAHTVNVRGADVTITADGKSATTKLVTYLPQSLDDKNLKFSWTLPATVVKNTTYAVTLSLTDKWGNPVGPNADTHSVTVQGAGSVQINSQDAAVVRSFDRNGQATVFLRSVKDIAGPGSITATLRTSGWTYPTGATGTQTAIGTIGSAILTDDKSTAWNETLWSNELTSNIEVLDSAPASTTGKVNVGSFNGKLVVYAANLNGARISWKVGGNWGSAVATSNYSIFNRPTPRAGVTVSVEVYVNGVKQLTKSVLTR